MSAMVDLLLSQHDRNHSAQTDLCMDCHYLPSTQEHVLFRKRESAHFVVIDPTLSHRLLTGGGKLRPSRVQSVVSSQGSMDSDMQGKD